MLTYCLGFENFETVGGYSTDFRLHFHNTVGQEAMVKIIEAKVRIS